MNYSELSLLITNDVEKGSAQLPILEWMDICEHKKVMSTVYGTNTLKLKPTVLCSTHWLLTDALHQQRGNIAQKPCFLICIKLSIYLISERKRKIST